MLRTGLAIYLAFVTAAGPWLCCCTVRGVFAAESTPARTQQHGKGGCCHRHTHAKPQSPAGNHVGGKQSDTKRQPPSSPGCPCQDDREPQAAALPGSPAAGADVGLGCSSPDAAGVVLPYSRALSASDTVPPSRDGRTPFVTSRDLLRVFHILRC